MDKNKLMKAIKEMVEDDKQLTYQKALALDVDAFIWISAELERLWKALVISADCPDYDKIQHIAAELYFIVDESKAFAIQTQEDLETLEQRSVING